YGCTTCIGNSGPLPAPIVKAIEEKDLVVGAVLSGNRNFEGRVSPYTKANYLASPPLVVAYAIAGNLAIDLKTEPIGQDQNGNPVYLKDIWPSSDEIKAVLSTALTPEMFRSRYSNVFTGDQAWQQIEAAATQTYGWDSDSTYVQNPPYFEGMSATVNGGGSAVIFGARPLALLVDSITTDHISPAGAFK
ncbi:MAG: aconitase family protein, partial [Cyanobacteria bacterium J06635_1]